MSILIKICIIFLPFYEIIIRFFPYATTTASYSRITKDLLEFALALIIGLAAIWSGNIKRVENKYIYLLVGFLIINFMLCPHLYIDSTATISFWVWKPYFYVICNFLMFVGIASLDINKEQIDSILKWIVIVAVIMAGIAILQYLKQDQFWSVRSLGKADLTEATNIVGTLGQPTILGMFLAMLSPILLYSKKYLMFILLSIAIIMTQCKIAMFATLFSSLTFFTITNKFSFSLIFLLLITGLFIILYPALLDGNGRYQQWLMALNDFGKNEVFDKKNYCLTGIGLGGINYFHPKLHEGNFDKLHNDYLEILRNMGIVGLSLFIMSIIEMFKSSIKHLKDKQFLCLLCGFIAIAICAIYSFVWQLGITIFYTVLFVGLIYNIITNRNLNNGPQINVLNNLKSKG